MQIKHVLFEFSHRQNVENFRANRDLRVKMVGQDFYNMEDYRGLICEKVAAGMITDSQYIMGLSKMLKIPDSVFEKSQHSFMSDKNKAREIEAKLDTIRAKYAKSEPAATDEAKVIELAQIYHNHRFEA